MRFDSLVPCLLGWLPEYSNSCPVIPAEALPVPSDVQNMFVRGIVAITTEETVTILSQYVRLCRTRSAIADLDAYVNHIILG